MSSPTAEVVVIGGGVIGLAIARALLMRGREVLLLERNGRLGAETSSRNSEVLHAGIYYPPGSKKAKFCVEGAKMLKRFAAEHGVPVVDFGKLLVATSEDELAKLASLAKNAENNGVDDLQHLTGAEAKALEPELACVAACLSPSSAVIDSHSLMVALDGVVTSLGGAIVLNACATSVFLNSDGHFEVAVSSGGEETAITASMLVIAAGHGASELASGLPYQRTYSAPGNYYAKGHYFSLSGKSPFEHLIYPMPSGSWLGIHLTRDTAGRAKFGPDFEWSTQLSYAFEDADGARLAKFQREVRRYWPGLPDGRLQPDYTGIRPKVVQENSAAADFVIHTRADHGIEGLVGLYGIDSPGLTSSPAIAEYVADVLSPK